MKSRIAIITAVSVMAFCLLNGCGYITGTTIDNTPTDDVEKPPADTAVRIDISAIKFSHKIDSISIRAGGGSIIFSGDSVHPDGTILQSQLYENDILLTWWPADREFQVRNGKWTIEVPLGENGAPDDITPCSFYFLKIWVKDNPSIIDGTGFDTIGPPLIISSEDSDIIDEEITLRSVMTNLCGDISFSGRTQLSDGTLLNAQLYEGVKPVAWWPSGLDIEVKEGKWNISLHLDEIGLRHDLSVGPVYTFTIWEKWHPSVSKTAWFDLVSMEIRQ
ncbi:MAG TPA: hypothetical protein VMW86_02005 [Dehalococcoidales bacterium]|nr:hypothetical protein [Dehalococcoidales bacterium]